MFITSECYNNYCKTTKSFQLMKVYNMLLL